MYIHTLSKHSILAVNHIKIMSIHSLSKVIVLHMNEYQLALHVDYMIYQWTAFYGFMNLISHVNVIISTLGQKQSKCSHTHNL